jgi:hypothetical protein
LALTVVTVGVLALAGQTGAGAGPHSAPVDHDRRAATLLLGITDDGLPVARPEDQRDARALGDRDVHSWSLPRQPRLWTVLESLAPAIGARFESRIALAPRGPPPAAASFVSP